MRRGQAVNSILQKRGQRIWKELLNPMGDNIGLSELLLLWAIKENEGALEDQIERFVQSKWKIINSKKKPDFFIVWSRGYDLHNELIRFVEIGLVDVKDWSNNEPSWAITERGKAALNEWITSVRPKGYLDPLVSSSY